MADYSVDIQAKLSGFEKINQLEKKLNSLKNNTVKINVELAGDAAKLLNGQMPNITSNAIKAGQAVGKGLNQGIKSAKFNGFYKDYFKQIEKDKQKASKLVNKYQNSTYAPTQNEALKAVRAKRSVVQKELTQQQKQLDSYIKKYELGTYKAQQVSMRKQLGEYTGTNSQSLESAKKFATEFKNIQSILGKHFDGTQKLSNNELISYFNKAQGAAKKFGNEMKIVASEAIKPFNAMDASTASNKTLTWLNNNTKAMKKYGNAFKDLAARQKAATNNDELKQYDTEFRNLVSNVQRDGLTGKSFFHEIGSGLSRIGQFVGTYAILQKGVQTLKQMGQAVLDVDTAMTELQKVSDASDLQLSTYFDEATESAKKYGATISDVISSTADWSRLGYSLEDAKKLSDITTLYQRVGDNMTQEKASESLVSTLQGFKLDADEANHIVDAFNEVGNNFAIGSDGIGEALQRSASSMMAANNTMEQTIGLVTAANEVVQDPDRVGNAFKTKFYRNCLYVQKCA